MLSFYAIEESLKKYLIESLDIIAAALLRSAIFVMRNLPVHLLYLVAEVLGTIVCLLHRRRRRQIYENLDIVYPSGPPFNKAKLARRAFVNMFLMVVDFIVARRILRRENLHEYVHGPGFDFYLEERSLTQGGILVTGHIGGMLTGVHMLAMMGYPMALVILPSGVGGPRTRKVYEGLFSWSGVRVVLKDAAYETLKKLTAEGLFPAVAVDQHGHRRSLYVDFLGRKAYTPAGAMALARHFQIPIYTGVVVRTGVFRFAMYVEKIPCVVTENKQADLEKMAEMVNQFLGKFILQFPDQWFWMHRRWRSPSPKTEAVDLEP